MRIDKSHRLCRIAVFGAFLESIVLHAQTTTPLDLLREAAAPGERISYGSVDLQFGELRVTAGTGQPSSGHPRPWWLLAGQDRKDA